MADDTIGTVGTDGGNTKKLRLRSRHWFFTFNNPDMDNGTMAQVFECDGAKCWVFQKEKGEQGTEHYQGYVGYINPRDDTSMRKLNKKIHWEPCKNVGKSINYGMKSETRIEGPWSKGIDIPEPLNLITEFRPWQQKIIDMVQQPPANDRQIHWYWEPNGNVGKTVLAKYLCAKHNAVFLSGKGNDIRCAIKSLKNHPKICIFHFVRTMEGCISYTAIEEVKDGIFFSGKYEPGMFIMNSPHVICFANFEPDKTALSADKWNIIRL